MKIKPDWRKKSLEILEKEIWDEPPYNSHLVIRTHELRKIPLEKFKTEDFRIMIGQKFGLPYLIPIAVEILEKDVLVSGDLYEGDLIQAVLNVDEKYWIVNKDEYQKLKVVIELNRDKLIENEIQIDEFYKIEV